MYTLFIYKMQIMEEWATADVSDEDKCRLLKESKQCIFQMEFLHSYKAFKGMNAHKA